MRPTERFGKRKRDGLDVPLRQHLRPPPHRVQLLPRVPSSNHPTVHVGLDDRQVLSRRVEARADPRLPVECRRTRRARGSGGLGQGGCHRPLVLAHRCSRRRQRWPWRSACRRVWRSTCKLSGRRLSTATWGPRVRFTQVGGRRRSWFCFVCVWSVRSACEVCRARSPSDAALEHTARCAYDVLMYGACERRPIPPLFTHFNHESVRASRSTMPQATHLTRTHNPKKSHRRSASRENGNTFSRYVHNLFRKHTPFTVHRYMTMELVTFFWRAPNFCKVLS